MCATQTVAVKRDVCRWVARPCPTATGWNKAALDINGTLYYLACEYAQDGDTGLYYQIVDFRKQDGTHYRLAIDPQGDAVCDCPWGTYRAGEKACRHVRAYRAAAEWLIRQEWADFEVARVRQENADGIPCSEAA